MATFRWKVYTDVSAFNLESDIKEMQDKGWEIYQIFPYKKNEMNNSGQILEEYVYYNIVFKRKKGGQQDEIIKQKKETTGEI